MLLEVDLSGIRILLVGLDWGLIVWSQLSLVLAVAVDLVMKRGFLGFEMSGWTRDQLACFELGCAFRLMFLGPDARVSSRFWSPRIDTLRDDGNGQRSQSGRDEYILYRGLHPSMLRQGRGRGNACP